MSQPKSLESLSAPTSTDRIVTGRWRRIAETTWIRSVGKDRRSAQGGSM
jgi:hypothetical protein